MKKQALKNRWEAKECKVLERLDTPLAIQEFLDGVTYSDDPIYRCPRSVLRDRKAHCLDGALFAAQALERLGQRPLLLDLRAERDDDHVIALYRRGKHWGAIAKSNFAGLRFREPIYRSLREVALSYFELYYNVEREKTLRAYSVAVDLSTLRVDWVFSDEAVDRVVERLDASRHFPLLTRLQREGLSLVDARSYEAGLVGVVEAGLYRPS